VDLLASGKLTLTSGRLVALAPSPADDACLRASYTVDGASEMQALEPEFAVVVNCAGFETPDASCSSPLIRDLSESGLCRLNATNRGFEVDEDYAATDGLFIAGPLLAGIYTAQLRTWHIENTRRIYPTSGAIARIVHARLQDQLRDRACEAEGAALSVILQDADPELLASESIAGYGPAGLEPAQAPKGLPRPDGRGAAEAGAEWRKREPLSEARRPLVTPA
jgi:hypothetical protein